LQDEQNYIIPAKMILKLHYYEKSARIQNY
jgi:hypothetical protein